MKTYPMKAEPMTAKELDLWLQGRIPRRHLAIPFGGDIPSKATPLGVDKEGEWFDEDTDLYGPFPTLRQSRDRLVDWHHVTTVKGYRDPGGVMQGAFLAKMTLDEEPSTEEVEGEKYYGVWANLWANLAEHRRYAIGALERRNIPLYGSSVPVAKAVQIDERTGHIEVWPVRFHTITTSPINTRAVLPPLAKADLLDDPSLADLPVGALRAFLTGEDDLTHLRSTSAQGENGAKAGRVLSGINESDIDEAVQALLGAADRLRSVLGRQRREPSNE